MYWQYKIELDGYELAIGCNKNNQLIVLVDGKLFKSTIDAVNYLRNKSVEK